MSQVATFQTFKDAHPDALADVSLLVVNSIGSDAGLPDLTDGVDIPVLQDTAEAQAFTTFGASKWYVYLIDPQGRLRWLRYGISMPEEQDRLLEQIALAREGA